jgi:hypothetical protein
VSPDAFWVSLLVKMAVTAAFVIVATKAAERAGALVGAMIATLPIAAGPSYVFLAFDHDAAFLAEGALASFTVNAATAVFALVYAALAQRRSLTVSLAAALIAWVAIASFVRAMTWTTLGAIAFSVVVFAFCVAAGNRFRHVPMPPVRRRWYDVPLRAAMVAVLVAVVIGLSRHLGPAVTGILAVYPIVLTSLILILHPRVGGPATAAIIAHTILGLVGFSLCCLTARLLIVPLGPALGLSVALGVSVVANLAIWAVRRRSVRAVPIADG